MEGEPDQNREFFAARRDVCSGVVKDGPDHGPRLEEEGKEKGREEHFEVEKSQGFTHPVLKGPIDRIT